MWLEALRSGFVGRDRVVRRGTEVLVASCRQSVDSAEGVISNNVGCVSGRTQEEDAVEQFGGRGLTGLSYCRRPEFLGVVYPVEVTQPKALTIL